MQVRTVGDWELKAPIGEGPLSLVFDASPQDKRSRFPEGEYVVKVIDDDTQKLRARILDNFELAKTIDAFAVVNVVAGYAVDDHVYIAMEKLEGQSLDRALRQSPGAWDIHQACEIVASVGNTLGILHGKGQCHFGLKPANLFLTNSGALKVLDVGLSAAAHTLMYHASQAPATAPLYQAPEVLEGAAPSPASDVYSLGAILYRLIAGRMPFEIPAKARTSEDVIEVIRACHREGLPPVGNYRKDMPDEVASAIATMMSRDPSLRPADGGIVDRLLGRVRVASGGRKPSLTGSDMQIPADSTVLDAKGPASMSDFEALSAAQNNQTLLDVTEPTAPEGEAEGPDGPTREEPLPDAAYDLPTDVDDTVLPDDPGLDGSGDELATEADNINDTRLEFPADENEDLDEKPKDDKEEEKRLRTLYSPPTEPPEDPLLGVVVGGNFKIKKWVADGAITRIYRAKQVDPPMPVLVKILAGDNPSEAMLTRFRREAKTFAALTSPHAVRVIDFGDHDGRLFMVTEPFEGVPLSDMLKSRDSLSERRVLEIMEQVCRALEEAHGMQIIHRGLTPESILIEEKNGNMKVKVADFGLASLTPGSALATPTFNKKLTQKEPLLGDPNYMAPELNRDDDASIASDIYALGAVAYRALAGQPPFEGGTMEVLRAQAKHEPKTFSELKSPKPIEPRFEALVRTMLDRDPKERPAQASDVRREIDKLKLGLSAPKKAPPAPKQDKPKDPDLLPKIAAAVLAVALILSVIYMLLAK